MSNNSGHKAHEIEDLVWSQNGADSRRWVFFIFGLLAVAVLALAFLG